MPSRDAQKVHQSALYGCECGGLSLSFFEWVFKFFEGPATELVAMAVFAVVVLVMVVPSVSGGGWV